MVGVSVELCENVPRLIVYHFFVEFQIVRVVVYRVKAHLGYGTEVLEGFCMNNLVDF